jgi:sulfonate transport system permease protein
LFAGIVLLGAIGFVSNALLALAEQRLLRWQRRH